MPGSETIEVPGLLVVRGSLAGAKAGDNQDAALMAAVPGGVLCAVADGVGSTTEAAAAARAAVATMVEAYIHAHSEEAGTALRGAVAAAHEAVRRATADETGVAAGATTIVAAVIRGQQLHVANAGDSRAYVLNGIGRLEQVTADHSWVEEQVRAGTLDRSLAATHPWRSVITRYLGGEASPEVDIFDRVLAPGARVLLCSDGLMAALSEDEVASVLAKHGPAAAVEVLLSLAEQRRAHDDVTLCIVQLETMAETFDP